RCGSSTVNQMRRWVRTPSSSAEPTRSGCRTRPSSAPKRGLPPRSRAAAGRSLPGERVRLELAGVGGAFGGREDLSVHVHACLLALATGRPVKMSYGREESFIGHVHRHPARLEYEHVAAPDGRLLRIRARLRFDGGAYASTSTAVIA